jgi:probable HAF family extracellular repeat protein
MTALNPFGLTGQSGASGINDSGQIVGTATVNGNQHAFIYCNGTTTDLGLGTGNSINASGQVAGTDYSSGDSIASIFSNGTVTHLGTLPGTPARSIAFAINASGQVAGTSYNSDNSVAQGFIYSNGAMTSVGAIRGYNQSWAYGIDDLGQVVGTTARPSSVSWPGDDGIYYHAFISTNGQMTDLNSQIDPSSGWKLVEANAINNAGQIVGYGYSSGVQEAFLLTPTPEPSTFALLGIGAIGLFGYAWRRRRCRG